MKTVLTPKLERIVTGALATVATSEGLVEIYKTEYSGRLITREKIDTVTKVFHPGIVIGQDINQRIWVAHNHYSNGQPTFDLIDAFSSTKVPRWDPRQVFYNRDTIVDRAILEVMKGRSYRPISYNCQTFVNLVARNEASSEAVTRISDGALFAGLLTAAIGQGTNSKGLRNTGLTIIGVSLIAKLLNNG